MIPLTSATSQQFPIPHADVFSGHSSVGIIVGAVGGIIGSNVGFIGIVVGVIGIVVGVIGIAVGAIGIAVVEQIPSTQNSEDEQQLPRPRASLQHVFPPIQYVPPGIPQAHSPPVPGMEVVPSEQQRSGD